MPSVSSPPRPRCAPSWASTGAVGVLLAQLAADPEPDEQQSQRASSSTTGTRRPGAAPGSRVRLLEAVRPVAARCRRQPLTRRARRSRPSTWCPTPRSTSARLMLASWPAGSVLRWVGLAGSHPADDGDLARRGRRERPVRRPRRGRSSHPAAVDETVRPSARRRGEPAPRSRRRRRSAGCGRAAASAGIRARGGDPGPVLGRAVDRARRTARRSPGAASARSARRAGRCARP